jgi:hypothetical protein
MFKDKEQEVDRSITYQVINYNGSDEKLEQLKGETAKALENISEKEVKEAENIVIDGVSITDFSDNKH